MCAVGLVVCILCDLGCLLVGGLWCVCLGLCFVAYCCVGVRLSWWVSVFGVYLVCSLRDAGLWLIVLISSF